MKRRIRTFSGTRDSHVSARETANRKVARKAAAEGIVLLKNDGILPLVPGSRVALFGSGAGRTIKGGTGSGDVNEREVVSIYQGLVNAGFDVTSQAWIEEFEETYRKSREDWRDAIFAEAEGKNGTEFFQIYASHAYEMPAGRPILASDCQGAGTAVYVVSRIAGEGADRFEKTGDYYLTQEEKRDLETLNRMVDSLVVVLNVGAQIDVEEILSFDKVKALLSLVQPGMEGGNALADVLTGAVNPSGKLTDTWAKKYEDIPASKNFYDCAGGKTRWDADHDVWIDTVYEEGLYVGYRYFATFDKEPAYPFGFGLSYTSFALTDVTCASDKVDGQETVTVSVKVTNTGKTAGKEVAQLYVKKPDGKLEQPSLELVAFDKTAELAPGESQILTLTASPLILSSYSEEQAAYIREKGTYLFYVGTSSADLTKAGAMEQGEDQIVKQVVNRMQPAERPLELSKRDPEGTYPKGLRSGVKEGVHAFEPKQERPEYPIAITEPVDYVADMSVEEMARLCVCGADGWGMEGIGEAGRMFKIEGYPIPDYIVADGNSGVNLRIPNIGMPTGTTICSSFNRELAREVGKVIGEEAKENGVRMILAPAMNLHRNPLNGRNSEYFSEDPLLAGEMAGNYCLGLEGTGVDGGYKHCIANNCESSRKRNQSIISERAIRELYFKAFEVAMKVHMPKSIMTAYNAVNGVPTSADADLILGLFREENGFDGFVMTDWNSYDTSDVVEMIRSGNNWLTPGTKDDTFTKPLVYAVADGRLSVERLRESASYIARVIGRAE